MRFRALPPGYSLAQMRFNIYPIMGRIRRLCRWRMLIAAFFPLLPITAVVGCAGQETKVESYESLPGPAQNRVKAVVDSYISCSVNVALKLDKGRRNVGRLAWTASESCPNEKRDIVRTMVKQGASHDAAFAHASNSQVRATAMAITAIQNRRAR